MNAKGKKRLYLVHSTRRKQKSSPMGALSLKVKSPTNVEH